MWMPIITCTVGFSIISAAAMVWPATRPATRSLGDAIRGWRS